MVDGVEYSQRLEGLSGSEVSEWKAFPLRDLIWKHINVNWSLKCPGVDSVLCNFSGFSIPGMVVSVAALASSGSLLEMSRLGSPFGLMNQKLPVRKILRLCEYW